MTRLLERQDSLFGLVTFAVIGSCRYSVVSQPLLPCAREEGPLGMQPSFGVLRRLIVTSIALPPVVFSAILPFDLPNFSGEQKCQRN